MFNQGDIMLTNNYSIKELNKILNIKKLINVKENEVFDYLRISDINNLKIEKKKDNVLFFPILLDQSWVDDGWVMKETDLQSVIDDVVNNNKNYTFLVEESMVDKITYKDAKLVVVDNIMDSIDKLYDYKIKNNDFKVIAVTGSVGKTTTAGMIENVVKKKYSTLRIYSDRITPIILKASIINFLNEKIDYVILEMGIYYKDHVEKLADLLHPDIAGITTIGDAHLDMEGLESKDRIAYYKSKIFKYAKYSIINADDDCPFVQFLYRSSRQNKESDSKQAVSVKNDSGAGFRCCLSNWQL
jgi:UDP-N-acetylmuramyl pentapeptide synthase